MSKNIWGIKLIKRKFLAFLNIVEKIITFFEEWTLFLTVIAAMVILFVNIVMRYLFNANLPWSEEFVREVIIYSTFIGISGAVKRGSEIKIDATVNIFPSLRSPLNTLAKIATLIFSILLIYYGTKMAYLMHISNQKTIVLQIPLILIYSILPLSGAFMFFRVIYSFLNPDTKN